MFDRRYSSLVFVAVNSLVPELKSILRMLTDNMVILVTSLTYRADAILQFLKRGGSFAVRIMSVRRPICST